MYEYKLKIVKVIDGDTIDGLIDCGFNIFVKKRIRLANIDAPETRSRDMAEKQQGMIAKKRLAQLLEQSTGQLMVRTELDKTGKFGRVLGVLMAKYQDSEFQGRYLNINQQLLSEGVVKPYGKV